MSIYYNPQDHDLTTVGEIEWEEPNYDFDLTIVLKDSNGKLYWADDTGCSCPTPFENHRFPEDFTTGDMFDLSEYLNARCNAEYTDKKYVEPQIVELMGRLAW